MATSERGKGERSHQDITLLLLLFLTAGPAGQVRSEDYHTTAEEPEVDGDAALTELYVGGDHVILPVDTAFTTLHAPGDEGSIPTEDNGWSGGGELNSTFIIEGTTAPPDQVDLSKSALNPLVIVIPLAVLLLLVVAGFMVAFIISRRRANKHSGSGDMREDEILHGCETEKIPMPMFEDDVPSVLELEMEDLEKWMIKDPGRICVDSGGGEN